MRRSSPGYTVVVPAVHHTAALLKLVPSLSPPGLPQPTVTDVLVLQAMVHCLRYNAAYTRDVVATLP